MKNDRTTSRTWFPAAAYGLLVLFIAVFAYSILTQGNLFAFFGPAPNHAEIAQLDQNITETHLKFDQTGASLEAAEEHLRRLKEKLKAAKDQRDLFTRQRTFVVVAITAGSLFTYGWMRQARKQQN